MVHFIRVKHTFGDLWVLFFSSIFMDHNEGPQLGSRPPRMNLDLYNYKNLVTVASKHASEGRLLGLRVSWGLGSLAPKMVPVEVLWRGGKRVFEVVD